jgi:hypothetical protein
MHYTTTDPKFKDSNPRPCTTPSLTPKKTKIRTHDHALHLTTNDAQKSKIRTHKLTEDHRSTPPVISKSQRFDPKTMHYTTIDPQ